MAIKEISGHILEIGDRVKMNIPKIGEGDMDGVEFTLSGENYWRYMNTHPDEVYTVEGFDNSGAEPQYILSGRMGGNTWYSDELLLQPAPQDRFEVIKNMTLEEMAKDLLPMILGLCEEGVPLRSWSRNGSAENLKKRRNHAQNFPKLRHFLR